MIVYWNLWLEIRKSLLLKAFSIASSFSIRIECAQTRWLLPCLSFPNITYDENQQAHGEKIESCSPLDCIIRFDYSLSTAQSRLFHINISALDFSQCLWYWSWTVQANTPWYRSKSSFQYSIPKTWIEAIKVAKKVWFFDIYILILKNFFDDLKIDLELILPRLELKGLSSGYQKLRFARIDIKMVMILLIIMRILESAFPVYNFLCQGHLILGSRQPVLMSFGSEFGIFEYSLPKANHLFLPLWKSGWKQSKSLFSSSDAYDMSSDLDLIL